MTKPELVTYIMEKTEHYKKTHLMEMKKTDLERIAAEHPPADATAHAGKQEASAPIATPEAEKTPVKPTQEAAAKLSGDKKRDAKTEINESEKILLTIIPQLADFKGVDSEMSGRAFVKKAGEVHGIPLNRARALFRSLRAKGYYSAKGKEEGQTRTTFKLSERGTQYLRQHGLLAAQ